jgi:hypothetical protein
MLFHAEAIAQSFNEFNTVSSTAIRVAQGRVFQRKDGSWMCLEALLDADSFHKFNSIGFVPALLFKDTIQNELVQVFCHYTFDSTKHKPVSELLADAQGVSPSMGADVYILTDPEFHTSPKVPWYGQNNFGSGGIESWFESYRVGQLAESLGMTHPFEAQAEKGRKKAAGVVGWVIVLLGDLLGVGWQGCFDSRAIEKDE